MPSLFWVFFPHCKQPAKLKARPDFLRYLKINCLDLKRLWVDERSDEHLVKDYFSGANKGDDRGK